MILVSDYLNEIEKNKGQEIRQEFYENLKKYDNTVNTQTFFTESVLKMIFHETLVEHL